MAHWIGAQGRVKVAKKTQKHPHLLSSPPENPKLKAKIFFPISTRRLAESVDVLNCSLALAADDLWPKKCEPLQWPAL